MEKIVCLCFTQQLYHSGAAEFASLKSLHEDNSYLYIMTESRVGGDLFEEICTYGSLTEPQAAKIFNEMLKVVQKLHSHEILHRWANF